MASGHHHLHKSEPNMQKRAALKRSGKVDENFDEGKENQPAAKKVCTASSASPRTVLGECNARQVPLFAGKWNLHKEEIS